MGGPSASSVCLHILDNGLPHNPEFLSTELLSKVLNCPPSGIRATRLLCDTLKTSKYVSSDNSCAREDGISPTKSMLRRANMVSFLSFGNQVIKSLFLNLRLDISKAWNWVRFVMEKGMYPVKLLPTRYRSLSCVRLPIVEGTVPEKGPRQSSNLSKELRYPMEGGHFPENLVRHSSNLLQRL
ncbi:hypothetical protein Cgig2_004033 [Carnegiea gigantea]|uniref:Uncharacterized protein n=1 Tax=Carnegiea gigantea TaxID=171969 RepID=A0A9Q1QN80_9CARY|nr:hypothetical protein Cgig2_004033 [Carnegiea gigantea]